jgi:hypothetical protein
VEETGEELGTAKVIYDLPFAIYFFYEVKLKISINGWEKKIENG